MKIAVDQVRTWGLGLAGALFLLGAVGENLPGVKLPLGGLHLWNDWSMFSKPGSPALVYVVGRPRGGGEPVIIDDPLARPEGFLDRLRDAREPKLHEQLAKPTVPLAVRQSFLAGVCGRVGARYEHVKMRAKAEGMKVGLGLPVAERECK